MIIKVKYRAVHWDNHQGASGKPFEDELLFNLADASTLGECYSVAHFRVSELKNDHYYGDIKIIDVSITSENIGKNTKTKFL